MFFHFWRKTKTVANLNDALIYIDIKDDRFVSVSPTSSGQPLRNSLTGGVGLDGLNGPFPNVCFL